MDFILPPEEHAYLRELAKKQADYAALPVMSERKHMWYALNDSKGGTRPPVIIETWTFDRDFLPASAFKCRTDLGRQIERQLLRNLRNFELIDDDKVMPDYFSMGWFWTCDELGVNTRGETLPDSDGVNLGFNFHHPIKDLERDLDQLKPAVCSVDKEKTYAYRAFLRELFDGLLDVRIDSGMFGYPFLTERVVELMGMEAFFMAMYDQPDKVHQLMAYLRDNCLRVMHWAEGEGLLRVNNTYQQSFGSSYNFTRALPAADEDRPAKLSEMWGACNSQETVGISPEMYHEFCFPYYRDIAAPMGLLYYGCCEPTHPFWEDISRYPHLKKVSMNRWCDEGAIGERLRKTSLVYSRKPDPNFLGVDEVLREDAWRSHIRATLEAARNVQLEFIIRDVYTVHGNLAKAKRAVDIAREEIVRAGRG
jgi:hypothetical protein